MDKNYHLNNVLKSHSINLEEGKILENYKTKKQKVKEALQKEYSSKIDKILDSGSYAKSTAINTKFDMDICIHFKRDSFGTLSQMYEDVYEFLNGKYKNDDSDLIKVRSQKVSSGLKFNVDGEDLLFDVTPGRKITEDYTDNDLYLHIRADEEESKRRKTNIQKQIENIKGKSKERDCIKLLKVWKYNHYDSLKSFLVELLTIKAYDNKDIDSEKGIWNRLKLVIEFIRDNIETISLIDPGNSGNNVADTLEPNEKTDLKNYLNEMLEKIDKDETKLKYYFPVNPKYPQDEEVYEHSGSKAATILTTQTFG